MEFDALVQEKEQPRVLPSPLGSDCHGTGGGKARGGFVENEGGCGEKGGRASDGFAR